MSAELLRVRDLVIDFPAEPGADALASDAAANDAGDAGSARGAGKARRGVGQRRARRRARRHAAAERTPVVRGIGFDVHPGEVLALVGESGSGKSVTALSLLRLVDAPGRVRAGSLDFDGSEVLRLGKSGLQRLRGAGIGMIFQEPMHSMNPVFTVGRQLTETLREHKNISREQADEEARGWLDRVGLPHPGRIMRSYPHELSGGMLQRAMIALALCCGPRLLIADEPTTALDVTVQARILDLLLSLRDETGMAILFITHDLGVVAQVADRVLVMYNGRILERADVFTLFEDPQHPYTRALLATKPVLGQRQHRLPTITDEVREAAQTPLPSAELGPDQADTVGRADSTQEGVA